ncbi:hypothetical protein NLU13_8106 [Sarocladium strictum]|uniref:PH domain-containing protein n=1 Tax=Sarocladium strictum TaxID=5046 RepID=A0AA39L4N5_SARSR|nr:hypothetical protein NLU13_8106 [Sarocladium strictum]
MAEAQKNVELPKETTEVPATTAPVEIAAPVEETKPAEETVAPTETVAAEDKVAEETKPAETAEEAKAEEKAEEVKPIEEGHLGHKAQGLSFPKNLIASKEFFFFGTDAFEPKALSAYQRSEKSAEVAQSNIAWASETGKGLLFIGDKKAPTGIINLSDAKDPEVDGANKFTLTSKGNKHTFKAASTAERDNWVSQLKLKIAEAKELAATVTESETYKATIESFKPAKEEKPVAAATTEEPAKAEETPAATEDAPKEDAAAAPATEEVVKEEPKRRSASRKRASFFGFGGKKESAPKSPKAEESKTLEEPTATEPLAAESVATETEAPKAEDAAATEAAPAASEEKPVEEVKTPPATTKRNSFFGGVFGKKEKKVAEAKAEDAKPAEATEEASKTEETTAATDAPVIPPVEASTPLAVEVNNPGTVPVETVDATAAPTVEEPKKDVKEKRKSSLPFAFGKRDKSPTPASDGESPKTAKSNPFSKFRATIKGSKSPVAPKAEDKTEEAPKEETAVESKPEEAAGTTAEATPAPLVAAEETKEPENKPENVSTTTPAVTAAA